MAAAAEPQYGTLHTNAELMQVALAASLDDIDNPRINTGNIDDVRLTEAEVANELVTLEERSVLATQMKWADGLTRRTRGGAILVPETAEEAAAANAASAARDAATEQEAAAAADAWAAAEAAELVSHERRAAAAYAAADDVWRAATEVRGEDRQSADEVAVQNKPYLLRAIRLTKVMKVIKEVWIQARMRRDDARRDLEVNVKPGTVVVTDAMLHSFAENGPTAGEAAYIPDAVAHDDGNFSIDAYTGDRKRMLHYSAMVRRLTQLKYTWKVRRDNVVRVLRRTVYMHMTIPTNLDLDTPKVYISATRPTIVLPIKDSDLVHVLQEGFTPRVMTRADAVAGHYTVVRFYADRPSRVLLPARNAPETMLGFNRVAYQRYKPRNIIKSFPPELMLAAFPDDDRYHRFVEWYNTVATEEEKRSTDTAAFSQWYNTKSARRSLFEAAAIAHPTADTAAMGETIARRLNMVRSRTLYAPMQ